MEMTIVRTMKMRTPMDPASSPCPAIRARMEKPPNLLCFFLARESWQFPKSDPRRRKPLFASFLSATLKRWQRCRWAEHPWSSPGADHVSPICRASLPPLGASGEKYSHSGQFKQIFVAVDSPRRLHDTCMKGNLRGRAAAAGIR